MQFLKTLFWVAVTAVVCVFSFYNWSKVEIRLWGGLEADIKLPVLVFSAFLIGFVPAFLFYRARIWGLRRRLEASERNAITAHSTATGPGQEGAAEGASAPPIPTAPITPAS